jgi:ABC-2 type transport system permease protein
MRRSAAGTSWRNVKLVAGREFFTRVRSQTLLVSTAIVGVGLAAALAVAAVAGGGDDDPMRVGVHRSAEAISSPLEEAASRLGVRIEIVPFDESADSALGELDLEAAISSVSAGSAEVTTDDGLDPDLEPVVAQATTRLALEQSLTAVGGDAAIGEVLGAVDAATVDVRQLDPDDPERGARLTLAYVVAMLLFFAIYLAGVYVAIGVVEEKANSIVEILLSAIRPADLLIGKVIGIGAVGLAQLCVYGGIGLAVGSAVGVISLPAVAGGLFAASLLWYVVGFAFYALLFAAAGSLVSRQEDVTSASSPVSVLAFFAFFAAQFALTNPESPYVSALSWFPPFSALLVPVRQATGSISAAEWVGTLVVTLAATVGAGWVAARVYRASVLHVGTPLSWTRAFRRASSDASPRSA